MKRVLLLLIRLYQMCIRDSLGIRHMAEIGGHDVVQAVDEALVDKLVEECHFLRRVLQHVGDDELDVYKRQTRSSAAL